MALKQKLVFVGSVIVIAMLACQGNIKPITNPTTEPTKPVETANPTYEALTRQISTVEALQSTVFPQAANAAAPSLPPGFLEDANMACAVHQADHTLSYVNKNGWQVYNSDIPTLIVPCPDGRMYLKIGNALYLYKNQKFIEEIKPDIYSPYLYSLTCGRGDEFWAWATSDKFMHFDGKAWSDFSAEGLGILGGIFGANREIAVAPNGNLWVINDDRIVTFDGKDWQTFEKGKGFEENIHPRGLVLDAKENTWVLSGGSSPLSSMNLNPSNLANKNAGLPYKLFKYDGSHWTTIPFPEDFYPEFMKLDQSKRVWVIARGGLIDSTLITYYTLFYTVDPLTNGLVLQTKEARFSGRTIRDVQFDEQGRLWVATNYGLDVREGSTWITYRMDNANLYANSADKMIFFGNGPQLPAPAPKAPGSVRGKFMDPNSTKSHAGLQVEVCLAVAPGMFIAPGHTPCDDEAYHAVTSMDADGNFLFTNIPAGRYYLAIQRSSDSWGIMAAASSPNSIGLEFEVYPGEEAQLGQITYAPDQK